MQNIIFYYWTNSKIPKCPALQQTHSHTPSLYVCSKSNMQGRPRCICLQLFITTYILRWEKRLFFCLEKLCRQHFSPRRCSCRVHRILSPCHEWSRHQRCITGCPIICTLPVLRVHWQNFCTSFDLWEVGFPLLNFGWPTVWAIFPVSWKICLLCI